MISAIIPVPNHTNSVAALTAFARFHPLVTEVIIIDDGSNGSIADTADSLRVRRVPRAFMGKGSAMRDGLKAANNEIILFLDGDLVGLREDLIDAMTRPLLTGQADFVKSKQSPLKTHWTRTLAKTLFPELSHIEQPMGGIVAARRPLLDSFTFEFDYGVHIGLLVDTALTGMQIAEVDVGLLEYDIQPLECLPDASFQTFRSLIAKAAGYGRWSTFHEQHFFAEFPQQTTEWRVLLEQAKNSRRIALIDLDHVLLETPLLVQLAQRGGNLPAMSNFRLSRNFHEENALNMIATLCVGAARESLEKNANVLSLRPGAKELVRALRGAGYRVGLISDGFDTIVDVLRRRLNADFCVSHTMKYDRDVATGKMQASPAMFHADGCCLHEFCRENILTHLCERTNIQSKQVLVIGGGRHDKCLLQAAGRSIGFQPETLDVRHAAMTTYDSTLEEMLPEINRENAAN